MRTLLISIIDLTVVAASVMLALFVRDDFALTASRVVLYVPYMSIAVACAAIVLPAMGIAKRVWRFSSLQDYCRLALASLVIVAAAVTVGLLAGQMGGVARSIPVLHGIFMAGLLVSARLVSRSWQRHKEQSLAKAGRADGSPDAAVEPVLVLSLGPLADVYLRALTQFQARDMRIVGILAERDRHVGRVMFGHPVLGTVDELERVLDELTVHAVKVNRVVVTANSSDLASELAGRLQRLQDRGVVQLDWLGTQSPVSSGVVASLERGPETFEEQPDPAFVLTAGDLAALQNRPYWAVKRVIDIVCAAALLVLLAPVIVLVWALVALEFGQPVMFWQMRPGRGGKPFRLYKFRSMAGARDAAGRRRTDQERTTSIGAFLRRTRLDELPQLVNILRGDMSFVGPRPLIQAEQSAAFAARLLVRPGLTGWAQVKGGRDISVPDKTALDVWYARNASFARDFEIVLRTVPMVLLGERVNADAIRTAWRELEAAGVSTGRAAVGVDAAPSTGRWAA